MVWISMTVWGRVNCYMPISSARLNKWNLEIAK
ncbi:hypothetical protein MTsDn5_00020 [Alteromonas gracilis]